MNIEISEGLKSAVNAYLMARTFAEVKREKVDGIVAEVLQDIPMYNDLGQELWDAPPRRLEKREEVYLCTDEELLDKYYRIVDAVERERGIKPDDMEFDHCPALVAEELQRTTERVMIECAVESFNLNVSKEAILSYLCGSIERYEKFIDLCVRLVVNHPGFESPLDRIRSTQAC